MSYRRGLEAEIKAADESTNTDTVLSDDSELLVELQATRTYTFRIVVFFDTVAAADFKYDVHYTGTVGSFRAAFRDVAAGATAFSNIGVWTAIDTVQSVTGAGTTGGFVEIDGVIKTTTAGTLSFRWAQDTSDASNTTVLEGSRLYVEEV